MIARRSGHRTWQSALLFLAFAGLAGCARDEPAGTSQPSATCDPGAPPGVSTIASGLDATYPILTVLRDDTLFFTTSTGIMKVALAGGATTVLAGGPNVYPEGAVPSDLHVDATRIYVSSTHWMVSLPVSGGQPTPFDQLDADGLLSDQIAIDGESLYWIETKLVDSSTTQSWMVTMPLAGGPLVQLASLGEASSYSRGVAVDEENVYWSQTFDGRVLAMPKRGGEVITIAPDQSLPGAITLDAASVYWMNDLGTVDPPLPGSNLVPYPDHVVKAPKSGGATTSFGDGTTVLPFAGGIAVNTDHVYWLEDVWSPDGFIYPLGSRVLQASPAGGPADVVGLLSTDPLSRPIPCPGGICWAAIDRNAPLEIGGSLMRYNDCP
ncbi:MAG: hypothetical protein QM820_28365 [Minicystis sp.]